MDHTQNYGAAFYSCAVGMGLSAICLALVGPAKSGMCQRRRGTRDKEQKPEEVEKISQDSDQLDFLEVDLALEDSPVKRGEAQDNTAVI